jgi:hemerythrin superfamily protein
MQSELSQMPVRGNDAVEILVNDHQTIKTMLDDLTSATQMDRRKDVLEQLKGALTIHNATEENLVYPALNKVAGKKLESEKLYHETAEADTLLFECDVMLKQGNDADFQAKARKLQTAILEHIDDEEQKAFPHLQKGANPQQAQMLTTSVREFRSALHFTPPSSMRRGGTETGEISSTGRARTGDG